MSDYGIGAPPPGIASDDVNPIGVPAGYKAKVGGKKPGRGFAKSPSQYRASLPRQVTPRYNEGDEWSPGAWSPERVADLQAQMVDAGILDPKDYQRGFWDATSMTSYKKLLAYSNAAGLDYQSTLQRYRQVIARYGGQPGEKGPTRQPFIGTRIDPERLNNLLDDVSTRTIGRRISPEEKARFATSFNDSYLAAQRQEYEMSGSGLPGGPGGTVTPPDPQGQGEKFVKEAHPGEVQEYDYVQRFKQFQQLLGG